MKKYLISIILSLTFSAGQAFAYHDYVSDFYTGGENTIGHKEEVEPEEESDVIFKTVLPDTVQTPSEPNRDIDPIYYYDDDREFGEIDPNNMPFFKQMRIRFSNKILEKQYAEKPQNASSQSVPKWKFWEKNKTQVQSVPLNSETDISNTIQSETSMDVPANMMSLSGGINKSVTEKEMVLDSDDVTFDEETGDMIATGRPVLDIPPQNTRVVADKMTYNEYSNILKAMGNVLVVKDGLPTLGEYLEIDMNEETMVMDGVLAKTESANAAAEKAIQKDGLLVLTNGTFTSDKSSIQRLVTRVAGPRFENMIVAPEAENLFFGNPDNKLQIKVGSLYVDARKNHDVFKAKDIKVYSNGKYILKWPSLTAYTNKQRDFFEANYPEIGSSRKVGMFAGPGIVFGGPFGSVIKAVPFINYKDEFGIGGMIKYYNTYNKTILGYGSANDIFFLKGVQRLDDNLFLTYGSNTYTNEWFIGGRMAKYRAELYYDKGYVNKNFLGKGLNLSFRHRAGFGLMQNDDRNYNGEKLNTTNMSTTRTRYMAQIAQTLFSYKNKEKRINLSASFVMQGSAALYGTGDTQFIARMGPTIHTQYKNWMQDVGYFLSGMDDHTPMPAYDRYRYGAQSVYIREAFRLTKYLSVGWAGYVTLSDDAPNKKLFQENAFIVSLGPDDCKLVFGYDFTRQRTYLGVNVAFDPKGTEVEYKRMEIKNPEKLGKKYKPEDDGEERQVAFKKTPERPELPSSRRAKTDAKPVVLQYAKVINIEDPDRERID